jgi:putative secretion ATPase (PEP-CTERM system associated)
MYERHFSFKHKPFDLVPNPDFLFLSSTHQKAITYLDYGIKEKIGFILLTGEIGSGKTTIVRNLINSLNNSFKLSRIHNTKVSSEQLIAMINEDFGLDIEGKNKTKLLSELNVFLIEQYSRKYQPILLIDEAQNLSPELLEEIRLLSNLETDRAKLLQIILVGQPELKKILMLPELMQLRQRINISYHIAPLTVDETAKYIKHRLTVAGNPEAIKFDEDMLPLIYRFSKGIPRLINILCDFALLTAFVEGKKEVAIDIVREVAKDLEEKDYWSETKVVADPKMTSKDENAELANVVGDVALRVIKLEKAIENNLSEIVSVTNKIIQLEKDVNEVIQTTGNNKVAEIIEQILRLERTENGANKESTDNSPQEKKEEGSKELLQFEKQITSLTRIVNSLNGRIKNYKLQV